ncbi:MAG: alpha-hydroxy-acid oxidizing protein, partial [Niallia sp.]
EKLRSKEKIKKIAAEAFTSWGIPTAECIVSVNEAIDKPIIASGGIKNGMDAAKAIALGSDMVGFARSILKEATESPEDLIEIFEIRELELQMAMFGIGAATIEELKGTDRIK